MSQRKAMVSIVIMAALFALGKLFFDSLSFRNKLVSIGCGYLDSDTLLHNSENQQKT